MHNPDPNSHAAPAENIDHLVKALHNMRDELVKTSLMLKDYQFQFDSVQRAAAAALAKVLIEKSKPTDRVGPF